MPLILLEFPNGVKATEYVASLFLPLIPRCDILGLRDGVLIAPSAQLPQNNI